MVTQLQRLKNIADGQQTDINAVSQEKQEYITQDIMLIN